MRALGQLWSLQRGRSVGTAYTRARAEGMVPKPQASPISFGAFGCLAKVAHTRVLLGLPESGGYHRGVGSAGGR